MYRGMASYDATLKKIKMHSGTKDEIISIEGEKTYVPYKGPVKNVVKKFLGGLASGTTYMGAKKMNEIIGKADFIEISNAGLKESKTHVPIN